MDIGEPGCVVVDFGIQKTIRAFNERRNLLGKRVFEFDGDVLVIDVCFDETRRSRGRGTTKVWCGAGGFRVSPQLAKATALGVEKLSPIRPVIAVRRVECMCSCVATIASSMYPTLLSEVCGWPLAPYGASTDSSIIMAKTRAQYETCNFIAPPQ